jgi:SAM-dependent methyltransferase
MTVERKRKNYQTFPDQPGGSQSFDKLVQLRLPPLAGKSFLDVGCNEGFFCGYARHQGAKRAVGIDMSADFVQRARARFPDCEFLQQTWDTLPEEKFDVILLASAIHYADDQPALIARLVDQLSQDGTLVLELGIVSDPSSQWVPVKRSIDTRFFPTMPKLREVLAPYAWKYVGKSVAQAGDPIGRFVVHIKRRRPIAYLLMVPSSYGKTYVANALFPKAGIPIVMGDVLLDDIAKGKREAPDALKALIANSYKKGEVDRVTREIFEAGLGEDFIGTWAGQAAASDIAFDGFIPDRHQEAMRKRLLALGYFPVKMQWPLVGDALTSLKAAEELAGAYREHLAATMAKVLEPAEPEPAAPTSPNLVTAWKANGALGFIDKVETVGCDISISGWAVDETGALPSSFMVKLFGGEHPCKSSLRIMRPDLGQAMGLRDGRVGYHLRLTLAEPAELARVIEELQVFAWRNGMPEGKAFAISPKIRLPAKV